MSATITANKEGWKDSQIFELKFWRESWPYRDWELDRLQELRHGDAKWLLSNMGFKPSGEYSFEGFQGRCLEVGCGPLGFFELVEGVETTAIDTLMGPYSRHLSFSTLGRRGNATYLDVDISDVSERFDFVVCSNVLDHTSDWVEFLELLTSKVSRGGQLILMTDTRGYPVEGHTQVFTPDQLMRVLKYMGGEEVLHYHVQDSKDGHCDKQLFCRVKL